jgi:hypothetical protein
MRTFWKAYEIAYISSIDTKAWFTSLLGRIQTFPESILGNRERTTTGHFLRHA